MSDRLADIIVAAAQGIVAHVNATSGQAPATKPAKPAAKPADKPADTKPAAAAEKPAATAAKPAAKPATKPATVAAKPAAAPAKVGKYSIDDVRAILRKVVATKGLGKQSAIDIMDEETGVQNINLIKPADYDKVVEACNVALAGGETSAADVATGLEDDTAAPEEFDAGVE